MSAPDIPLVTRPVEVASMTTRDGVRLDADIYRPAAPGSYPVLLMRQAYGRRIASTLCVAHPQWYAAHGFIVVVQDIRGRGTSEGTFSPGLHDAQDGAETVAWAARLPGSNGRVGMYGFSYQGYGQYLTATLAGPELQAIAPSMAPWDAREGWSHSQGAFRLQSTLAWATQLAAEAARHQGDAQAYADLTQAYHHLPLRETVPAAPAYMAQYSHLSHYADWRDTPADAPYWNARSAAAQCAAIAQRRIPTLVIAGWYDCFVDASLQAWRALHAASAAPVHLVVGPWLHFPWVRRHSAIDFGPQADGGMDALQLRWFQRWLQDVDNGVDREAPVQLFDMGRLHWQHHAQWPDAQSQTWYLAGDGQVALQSAGGQLLAEMPEASAHVDHIVTDPWRPPPSVGGALGSPAGAVDRTSVDARGDVLTYTTAPLTAPLALAGDVAVELAVACDRPSFDLACTLSRVGADGQVIPLSEGYRCVAPSEVAPVIHVRLSATCATLQPGDALRLSIAGAAFPAYAVNPGTGEDPKTATGASALVTTVGVHYGGLRPSCLHLHLAPES